MEWHCNSQDTGEFLYDLDCSISLRFHFSFGTDVVKFNSTELGHDSTNQMICFISTSVVVV